MKAFTSTIMRSLFGTTRQKNTEAEERVLSIANKEDWAQWWNNASKVAVTKDAALRQATALACVRAISRGIAQMPLKVYERGRDKSTRELVGDPMHTLLWIKPNSFQSSFEFIEQMTMHLVLQGNALAIKVRNERGKLLELVPIVPANVSIKQEKDWSIIYSVNVGDGKTQDFNQDQVLHIRNSSWDGYKGLDVVQLAGNALGLAISLENNSALLHANGARPSGILTTEATLSEEVVERLKRQWKAAHGGQNKFGTAVLDSGFKFMPVSMSAVDSQLIEQRKHQIEEVCRVFGVFPSIVMHSDKTATHASAEAFFSAHLTLTLAPYRRMWEQRLDLDLLDGEGPRIARFDVRDYSKASLKDTTAYLKDMVINGIMTRNEAREYIGLDPIDGLDVPLIPRNMAEGSEDLNDDA